MGWFAPSGGYSEPERKHPLRLRVHQLLNDGADHQETIYHNDGHRLGEDRVPPLRHGPPRQDRAAEAAAADGTEAVSSAVAAVPDRHGGVQQHTPLGTVLSGTGARDVQAH